MMSAGRRVGVLLVFLAHLVPASTRAATLEVLVRTDAGVALAGVVLAAEAIGGDAAEGLPRAPGDVDLRALPGRKPVVSGQDGRARFELSPGQYRIVIRRPRGTELRYVAPGDDPRHPGITATLTGPLSHARVELVLTEGTLVAIAAKVFGGSLPSGGIPLHFQEATTGFRIEATMIDGYHERVLAPGRWRLTASIPPGHLLVGLERDGQALPGHEVALELSGDPRPIELWWLMSAPCRIAGRVSGNRVPVEARLIEAGAWLEDARARGGFEYERVEAMPLPNGWYEMVVPDGRWQVRPVAGDGAEVSPESVELALAPGARGAASFDVRGGRGAGSAGGHILVVRVETPDPRERIEDARVELQRVGTGGELNRVIATCRTRRGACVFTRLAPGPYRAVVGHRDYLEGAGEATLPVSRDPASVEILVRLAAGGRIHVIVEPAGEAEPPRVAVAAEWLEEAPPTRFLDDQNVASAVRRSVASDATGHAHLRGLLPGRWRVRARSQESDPATSLVRIGVVGGARVEELEVAVPAEATVELVAAVVPAARLEFRLACDDGGPLPPTVDVRVLDAQALGREKDGTVFQRLLDGPLADTVRVGPLEPGPRRIAVRPTGFDAETWLPSGEDPARAEALSLVADENADFGIVEVACAPRLRVAASVPQGLPVPDLRNGRVEASAVRHAGGREEPWSNPSVTLEGGAVVLGGLPEGLVTLSARLSHRHVLPGGMASWSFPELELARGRIHRVSGAIAGVGGSVRLPGPVGCVRALRHEAGSEMAPPVVFGGPDPEVGPLIPGVFAVSLAAGEDCEGVVRQWSDVEVEPARTVELR